MILRQSWEAKLPRPEFPDGDNLVLVAGMWTSQLAVQIVNPASIDKASLHHTPIRPARIDPALTAEMEEASN